MQKLAKFSHLKLLKVQNKDFINTKYIKYLAFYLLSYFGIAIMVDFKFAFMLGNLNLKWLNFKNWSDKF